MSLGKDRKSINFFCSNRQKNIKNDKNGIWKSRGKKNKLKNRVTDYDVIKPS